MPVDALIDDTSSLFFPFRSSNRLKPQAWVVFSAGISNLALFEAEMSADAWQLMGMAERGYLPKILAQRSRYNTPKYGIAIGLLVIIAMSVADFSQLVESKLEVEVGHVYLSFWQMVLMITMYNLIKVSLSLFICSI